MDGIKQRMIQMTPQQPFKLPKDAREIIVIRHGSSEGDSANGVPIGDRLHCDPELLPRGHSQAESVARRLSGEPISAVFATVLKRTQQTAAPLAAALDLELQINPDLHEVHMGDWEHDFHARAAKGSPLLGRLHIEGTWEVFPNAEPLAHVTERVRRGMRNIAAAIRPGQAAAVVVHGGIIGEICRLATDSRQMAFSSADNGSISRIIIHGDTSWSLRGFNDVSHLFAPQQRELQ